MIYLPLFFLIALLLSLGLTKLMISVGPKLGLIDEPGERRIHKKPIPRAGGIAVWAALMITVGLLNLFFDLDGRLDSQWFKAFACSSLVLIIVGFIDDRRGVRATIKLGAHILSAVILFVMSDGGTMGSIMGIEVPWWVDLGVWIVWTVLIINAFNLIDGMDGLCAGLAIISVTSLTIMSLASRSNADAVVLACMVGALLGFLRYNFNPAGIFLGDTGSMFIGFFIASVGLNAAGERFTLASLLLPLIVAGVPLIDVLLAVWRRSFQRWRSKLGEGADGQIFGADQDHLHHRLLSLGLNQRKVASILYSLAIAASTIALLPYLFDDKTLGLTIGAIIVCLLMGFRYLAPVELSISGEVLRLIIQRPARTKVSRFLLTCYDAFALFAGLLIAYLILNDGRLPPLTFDGLKNTTIAPTTAITIAIGLFALNASKAHVRRWSRSSLRDFIALIIWFYVGTLITITVNIIISDDFYGTIQTHTIAFGFTGILIVAPRALGACVRESVVDSLHRHATRTNDSRPRVLLYGAGDVGHLFLNHVKITADKHFEQMRIVGFLDDHPSLNYRFLDGFRIRGGLKDLYHLDEYWNLHGVILTTSHLTPEKLTEIEKACESLGLTLYQWAPDLDIHPVKTTKKKIDSLSADS